MAMHCRTLMVVHRKIQKKTLTLSYNYSLHSSCLHVCFWIVCFHSLSLSLYLTYLSMNFLWKSLLRLSLMKVFSFLSGSALEQFLKTTSSSQRRLSLRSDFSEEGAYLSLRRGFPLKMFSIRIRSSSCFLSSSFSCSSTAFSFLIFCNSVVEMPKACWPANSWGPGSP